MSEDNSKEVFLKTWPGGYRENWSVYGAASGKTEAEVVSNCLSPFYNKSKRALEIGCGRAFWTDQYLAKNFKHVTALDLLPSVKFASRNIKYLEVPDRDFSCYGVPDNSVDFCWSFGVFCHMSLGACQQYVNSIFSKLVSGGEVALYFSNNDRRPLPKNHTFSPEAVQWVRNDFRTSQKMLTDAGFIQTRDLMPDLMDTMIYGKKP
jgi:cyclopropane fatty-acyl-phospholipid synthase-like methyltransferase